MSEQLQINKQAAIELSSSGFELPHRRTRKISIGSKFVGGDAPISVQSMCATRTTDIDKTVAQISLLEEAGADFIRIAVDSRSDIQALREIRKVTSANLVVDLQESYSHAAEIAPLVQKIRYNPGHLHHHQRKVSVEDKVKFIVDAAASHGCAVRIGVNFGSLDPERKESGSSPVEAALASAEEHCELMDKLGFERFVVSLKSSDPLAVVEANVRFSSQCPEIPLHLGVTEAGMLPSGEIKTRVAFEQLISNGIGDTVRVSLTLPDSEKHLEITTARKILEDIASGRFRSFPTQMPHGLNVISCPSCSRVENTAFVDLARKVQKVTQYAKSYDISIAVMGCRVNGPGETDEADLGLWCAPKYVNLKRKNSLIGQFAYDEVIGRMLEELEAIVKEKQRNSCQ